MRSKEQMNMIRHDDPRVHLVVPDPGAIVNGCQDQFSNVRLPEKHRPPPGLIEQPVHGDECFAGSQIGGWKRAIGRKTAVQAERDEQRLADYIEMREPAFFEKHNWVVRRASGDSQSWRPGRPPQATSLPHFCILLLASLVFVGTLSAAPVRYPSPIELAVSPDGARLFVLCEGTDELVFADAHSGKIAGRVQVGRVPKGLWLSGRYAYVANSWSDTVSVVDTSTLQVTRTLKTGFEPNAVFADPAGATIYTGNRIGNDISVIDLATGAETRRLAAGRGARYLTPTPDGQSLFCTHIYPNRSEERRVGKESR